MTNPSSLLTLTTSQPSSPARPATTEPAPTNKVYPPAPIAEAVQCITHPSFPPQRRLICFVPLSPPSSPSHLLCPHHHLAFLRARPHMQVTTSCLRLSYRHGALFIDGKNLFKMSQLPSPLFSVCLNFTCLACANSSPSLRHLAFLLASQPTDERGRAVQLDGPLFADWPIRDGLFWEARLTGKAPLPRPRPCLCCQRVWQHVRLAASTEAPFFTLMLYQEPVRCLEHVTPMCLF
ncbi:unnamed protein product [Protopolystoma xenopodis]|uniref:Uncharacterized protein n=1 Tax=Protopolystoma xenopodis TaxID=117903 RepID=A0A3S5FGS4_9PLAT|nr:unnamed protein product [Protopolystoma xenopodis]